MVVAGRLWRIKYQRVWSPKGMITKGYGHQRVWSPQDHRMDTAAGSICIQGARKLAFDIHWLLWNIHIHNVLSRPTMNVSLNEIRNVSTSSTILSWYPTSVGRLHSAGRLTTQIGECFQYLRVNQKVVSWFLCTEEFCNFKTKTISV